MSVKPDRYKSFIGIEADANATRLIELVRRHIDAPPGSNPFWERFGQKLDRAGGSRECNLYLVYSNLCYLEELFEERGDEEALVLLNKVEADRTSGFFHKKAPPVSRRGFFAVNEGTLIRRDRA